MHRRELPAFVFCLFAWPIVSLSGDSPESERRFWAYELPSKVAPPETADKAWPRGDIDRFILAHMEQSGLRPAPDADRTVLVRRIYFDLTGLPPTVQQIDEFLHDRASDSVAALVDRLLDSPQFGERWGRHWLDVARYADSSGGGRSLLFPNAWRYRDYVVESLNRDKPFDQFIREQVAGDLLPFQDDKQRAEQLIATTFLMIGAHNYELQDKEQLRMDVVDEQIEAVGRAFLAQTLGCARCHDHKFDPIPTADYYALAGIFRSTKSLTPGNVSGFEQHELPVNSERRTALDEHAVAVRTAQQRLDEVKASLKKQADMKSVADSHSLLGIVVDDEQAKLVGNWTKSKANSGYLGEGYIHDGATGKGEKSVTFQVDLPHDGLYEVRVSYTHGANRSPSVPVTIRHADDQETVQIDERQPPPIDGRFIALGRWRFLKGSSDAAVISNEGTTGHVIVDAVQFVPVELLDSKTSAVPASAAANGSLTGPDTRSQSRSASEDTTRVATVKELESRVKQIEQVLKELKDRAPPPAPLTMGVKDEQETGDFHVCIRGIVHNLGDPVRRGFLSAIADPRVKPPEIADGESGRRELADWLASSANPLTARVAVNRIWSHLFGVGLVRTTENFGLTGEAPSHPDLLDWLALRFVDLRWSHKKIIREIVLSRCYQMSCVSNRSADQPAVLAPAAVANDVQKPQLTANRADPGNRLLSRQNRKRVDAECLRDALLAISGQIDLTRGGPAMRDKTDSEYGYSFDSRRRSVYLPVFRNNLADIFDVFDFADPNTPTGHRNTSTLPSQALYFMNSPFVINAAQQAAEELLELDLTDPDRIDLAYRRALGRLPSDAERGLAIRYIHEFRPSKAVNPAAERLQVWTRFYQMLFASLDFRYVY